MAFPVFFVHMFLSHRGAPFCLYWSFACFWVLFFFFADATAPLLMLNAENAELDVDYHSNSRSSAHSLCSVFSLCLLHASCGRLCKKHV